MKSIGGADGAAVGRSAASSREQGRSSRIPVQCGRIVLKTAAAAAVGTRPVRLGRLVDWRRTADGGRRVRVQSRGRSGDHDKTTRAPKSLVLGWKAADQSAGKKWPPYPTPPTACIGGPAWAACTMACKQSVDTPMSPLPARITTLDRCGMRG